MGKTSSKPNKEFLLFLILRNGVLLSKLSIHTSMRQGIVAAACRNAPVVESIAALADCIAALADAATFADTDGLLASKWS